jgi:hypothetical membrane protein
MQRVKVFSDRYPFLGPFIWFLSVQYFIVQVIVASAWSNPGYSWLHNTISDLGNTSCGVTSGRQICSPEHTLMNISFVTLGIIMATGSLLIYQEFREKFASLLGFSFMGIAGFGAVLVGIFPENTVSALHFIGALLAFLLGNVSMIILSGSLIGVNGTFRAYTLISGLIGLIALPFFMTHTYLGLGIGGMERIAAYPEVIWLIFFGLYMSGSHYRRLRSRT